MSLCKLVVLVLHRRTLFCAFCAAMLLSCFGSRNTLTLSPRTPSTSFVAEPDEFLGTDSPSFAMGGGQQLAHLSPTLLKRRPGLPRVVPPPLFTPPRQQPSPRAGSGESSERDAASTPFSPATPPRLGHAERAPSVAVPPLGDADGAPPVAVTPRRDANGRCDKCDSLLHDTDDCPHYPKARDAHPDATRRRPLEMGKPGGNFVLRFASVTRQPGDGSCLYHSLAFGLGGGERAEPLRRELADWVAEHPDEAIADTPLKEWVLWDSGSTVAAYAARQRRAGWGGGIEMAACSRAKNVNIFVYEQRGGEFKRISCFDAPTPTSRTLHVLYAGGVHYDALSPTKRWDERL